MDYFAGLDISMEETHVCVLDREGAVVHEARTISTAEAIFASLAKAPSCRRVVFETGRMAPMLYHGLRERDVPVVCIESRQAYQALKSLATHKTDRNDARGLAHLARTGFFKPTHVKSLPAHAIRSLVIARKKLVGQRVMLENQIRGLAVVFGVRLPRALSPAFIKQALQASEGIDGLSAAMRGLIAARAAVLSAVSAIDADMKKMAKASGVCRRLMTIPGVGKLTALAFAAAVDDPERFRAVSRHRRLSRPGAASLPVGRSGLHRQHLKMRRPANAIAALRSGERHADALQRSAEAEGLGAGDRGAVHDAKGADCARPAACNHHACHAPARHRVQTGVADRQRTDRQETETSSRAGATPEGGNG